MSLNARELASLVAKDIQARDREVTKTDTERIEGRIERLDSKLAWMLGLMGAALALILATHGAMAFFSWRMVERLVP